ncbi:hypothetical protein BN863_28890 [Formosa agariphila KMM 3901]|uniref:Lipoprotein n=1 Tax=Formosa agariphila (strain DSM 15362 / KCTC 12365 / LMG 23005 / KMM 3901 / M-2Alg 35-1) TaxID=1347342 RepID=T2KQ67_FORAG|nr:hypothetical protein [Formosa agariphila]CDF80601.1 hypothetical protein BN863_28890 [Formosa agariphila KMM 3901]
MKKLIVLLAVLTAFNCKTAKTINDPKGNATGVMVERRLPVKNKPGLYKYFMSPLNGKSRSFIVISTAKFEEKKPVYFNQTPVQ